MSDKIVDEIVPLFHVEDFEIIAKEFYKESLEYYFVNENGRCLIYGDTYYTSRELAEIDLENLLLKTIQDNLLEISTKEFSIETLKSQNELLKTRLTLLTTSKEI